LLMLQKARQSLQRCDMQQNHDGPQRRSVSPSSQVSLDPELSVLIKMLLLVCHDLIFHRQLSFECYFILK
jgi:hypothetical protein